MKKMYFSLLLPVLLFCSLDAHAVVRDVTVASNTFTPATMTVNVGDVVKWTWVSGFHTTTSLSIPAGAAAWNSPITSNATTFSYTVTVVGNYNYECSPHSPSMAGSFTAVAAMPLELQSFSGKTTGSSNWLNWETVTEKDVQAHIVERSADGKQWAELGRRPGSLNSTVLIQYELEDAQPFNQTYYRLRSIDFDGKMAFSRVVILGEKLSITKVFPNPAVDQVTVQFTALAEEDLRLSIVDLNGRLVWYQPMETKPGLNTTVVPMRQLPAGAYDLLLTNSRKMMASLRVMKK